MLTKQVKLKRVSQWAMLALACVGVKPTFGQTQLNYKSFVIDEYAPLKITPTFFSDTIQGGDTIFVSPKRTKSIYFEDFVGNSSQPIVVTNFGGQVVINDPDRWGAISFKNCKYIKISGAGSPTYKYGFQLTAKSCGLSFTDLSSDCEAEFVKVDHDGFFGIMAKKDYGGNPPSPPPVFENLKIHDCFVTGVHEGMYLGETKSPGMEFKHVRVYNNVIVNTGYEGIQIANMTEDVEVYNNTIYKAGQEDVTYQNGIFQIGDNTEAKVYNNVFSHAPGLGIMIFGKGNIHLTNNYISDCNGVFTDNRQFSDIDSPITFVGNYFKNIDNNQVIKSYNQMNQYTASNNVYEDSITFFLNQSGNDSNTTLINNLLLPVDTLTFVDPDSNNYALEANPFVNLGATGGPEFFNVVDPNADQPEQIVLTNDMLVDLMAGGSVFPAEHLIDEQEKTFVNGLEPTSQSWKPHYNMNYAPYHVYFDLKHMHHLSQIGLHDMHNVKNLEVSYGKPGDWKPLFTEPCNNFKTWKIHDVDVDTRYIRLSMYESVFAAVNEINLFGYPINAQITLVDSMITDEVTGGSQNSPLLLIDEQDSNAVENAHPTSSSWKPHFNMDNAPYYVTIDLGQSYDIFSIFLHDMNNVADFKIEYGSPGNWQDLLIESCDRYKTWKQHKMATTTQYLRLSMHESVYAAINEIQLFGIPTPTTSSPKIHQDVVEEIQENQSTLVVYPNPVSDLIYIQLPKEANQKGVVEILDALGRAVFTQKVEKDMKELTLSTKAIQLTQGYYFLRYTGGEKDVKSLKFYKY